MRGTRRPGLRCPRVRECPLTSRSRPPRFSPVSRPHTGRRQPSSAISWASGSLSRGSPFRRPCMRLDRQWGVRRNSLQRGVLDKSVVSVTLSRQATGGFSVDGSVRVEGQEPDGRELGADCRFSGHRNREVQYEAGSQPPTSASSRLLPAGTRGRPQDSFLWGISSKATPRRSFDHHPSATPGGRLGSRRHAPWEWG